MLISQNQRTYGKQDDIYAYGEIDSEAQANLFGYGDIDSEANYVNMTNPRRYDDDMYAEAIEPRERTTAFQETEGTYSAPRGPRARESLYVSATALEQPRPKAKALQATEGTYSAPRGPRARESLYVSATALEQPGPKAKALQATEGRTKYEEQITDNLENELEGLRVTDVQEGEIVDFKIQPAKYENIYEDVYEIVDLPTSQNINKLGSYVEQAGLEEYTVKSLEKMGISNKNIIGRYVTKSWKSKNNV